MARPIRWLLGVLLFVTIVGGPLAYAKYRKAYLRGFAEVDDGVLYRSGQLSNDGLKRVLHDHGIRTVVTLRAAKQADGDAPDAEEEDYCRSQETYYYRLPYREKSAQGSPWVRVDGKASVDEFVDRFLAIMDEPKHHPVLVHCFAGKNRSGAFVAIYRMEYQHWSSEDAIAELKAAGYHDIAEHNDILHYLQTYQPRWKQVQTSE